MLNGYDYYVDNSQIKNHIPQYLNDKEKEVKMKNLLLVFALILLITSVYAQKGMFEISYDDSVSTTIAHLKDKGIELRFDDRIYRGSFGTEPEASQIIIYPSYDSLTVSQWEIRFNLGDKTKTEVDIIEELKSIHGDYDVYQDYDYDYIWYFPNDRAHYVFITNDGFVNISYTFGNWDEDDYYYYWGY